MLVRRARPASPLLECPPSPPTPTPSSSSPLFLPPLPPSQGELRCRPNAKNHRDLDVELDYNFTGKNMTVKKTQPFRIR